jgi:hypothetical protein
MFRALLGDVFDRWRCCTDHALAGACAQSGCIFRPKIENPSVQLAPPKNFCVSHRAGRRDFIARARSRFANPMPVKISPSRVRGDFRRLAFRHRDTVHRLTGDESMPAIVNAHTAETVAKPKANSAKVMPVSREEYNRNCKTLPVTVAGKAFILKPWTFSTGSLGLFTNGTVDLDINGTPVAHQVELRLVARYSKPGEPGDTTVG